MHLYHGLGTLRACAVRDVDAFRSTYNLIADLLDPEFALSESDDSLGEAHDCYELGIFSTVNERCLYFLWREFRFRGSGCPPNEAPRTITLCCL